jgi:threonine dehydrogenase-like Zn-dependent dehydrogenase
MRELTFIRPGALEWYDVPEPHLQNSDDALVRPVAVAACDLDVWLLRARTPFHGPFAIGHEFVGEIVELGENVPGFRVGQLVVVAFQIGCGECDPLGASRRHPQ